MPRQRVARALQILQGCHPQHHPRLLELHQQQLKGKQPMLANGGQQKPRGAAALSDPPLPWAKPEVPRGTVQATFAFKGFDEARSACIKSTQPTLFYSPFDRL